MKNYVLVFILLFFSGNPLATFLFGKFNIVVGLIAVLLLLNVKINLDQQFFKKYRLIVLGIVSIFVFHLIFLQQVAFLAYGNILLKFLLGGIVIWQLNEKFQKIFFRVIGILSFTSLCFFALVNLIGFEIAYVDIDSKHKAYLIYCTSIGHIHRNAGMFWEPGAFAGIITICLALNIQYLPIYWKHNKFYLFSILLALITTQSTSGYIVGFVVLIYLFLKPKHLSISLVILPLALFFGSYIYNSNDFLNEKINAQFEKSESQEIGEFSNTRLGSVIFDWYYIQKHPLIGNGFDQETRYSDHQYLFNGIQGDAIGSGNSFSHYWASLGVMFIIGYFMLLWKQVAVKGKIFAILILIVVFLNLQSEQWFNFPLYLGFIFLFHEPQKQLKQRN